MRKFTEEEEKQITRARDMVAEVRDDVEYSIQDNCVGDGEVGWFNESGVQRFTNRGGGEFFTWEELLNDIGADGLEDILDCAILID